nr:RNA-directed DNA polymerase, eukaryota [Tanacetum cinerariifolium]
FGGVTVAHLREIKRRRRTLSPREAPIIHEGTIAEAPFQNQQPNIRSMSGAGGHLGGFNLWRNVDPLNNVYPLNNMYPPNNWYPPSNMYPPNSMSSDFALYVRWWLRGNGTCPNISSITLDQYLSDHWPILMREVYYDYGPMPFRLFHYWFEVDGFDKFIKDSWKDAPIIESNALVRMMKKLKFLKEKIRMWNKLNKEKSHKSKRSLLAELADCAAIINKGVGENNVANRRRGVVNLLQEVKKKNSLKADQKAKIKWATEGDENSKCYHGVINKKKNQLSIRGILVEGTWIDSPSLMKNAVMCFFHQGSFFKGDNSSFIILIPKTPDANMVNRLISLIGSMYKIISKILANRLVVVLGDLKKKQSFVFKVDFEKAYDSVRWDHLDDIMRKFGFGEKWCMWIQSCLRSYRGSVIVNGSPTEEFQFYKGLKQGLFKGIELAHSLNLSHMFYVNDAIFMGQLSESNIDTIVKVLDSFNRASGLRINMTKSKLLDISVKDDKVKQASAKIGCSTLRTPFSYLGSKVGGCMSRIQSWNEPIERMECRLSKWKLKTLSIGGRLTLLKSVLVSMPIYHMSLFIVPKKVLHRMESMRSHFFNGAELSSKKSVWVKWKHVLASKDKGGLVVSSLFALNRALMFKLVWRFITQGSSLWARVIKALHGYDGKIVKQVYRLVSKKNNANTSRNKKKDVESKKEKKKDAESKKEVSNLNPFEVLYSVKNDVDLGTNDETSDSKEANSSRSSFWNVGFSSTSTTLIVEKIDKFKKLMGNLHLWMMWVNI